MICMVNQPGQILIGRQREMETLTSAFDDALAARGQMVMLAGEPGIGKTRLAQELASHAESLGARCCGAGATNTLARHLIGYMFSPFGPTLRWQMPSNLELRWDRGERRLLRLSPS